MCSSGCVARVAAVGRCSCRRLIAEPRQRITGTGNGPETSQGARMGPVYGFLTDRGTVLIGAKDSRSSAGRFMTGAVLPAGPRSSGITPAMLDPGRWSAGLRSDQLHRRASRAGAAPAPSGGRQRGVIAGTRPADCDVYTLARHQHRSVSEPDSRAEDRHLPPGESHRTPTTPKSCG